MKTSNKFGKTLNLLESEEDLTAVANLIKTLDNPDIGLDTETSGLDYIKDKIAGVCFSIHHAKHTAGYYIPLRHKDYPNNLNPVRTVKFVTWLYKKYKILLFNRDYDHFMLETDGFTVPPNSRHFDVQIMVWEAFSERLPSLKVSAERFLKIKMPTFLQTVSKARNADQLEVDFDFSNTDPEVTYTYACFSVEHKFLTRSGFKTFDEIGDMEEIAQYNPNTRELEFVVPLRRIDTYSDNVFSYGEGRVSGTVSDNHRVYGRYNSQKLPFVKQAADVFDRKLDVVTGTQGYEGREITEPFLFPHSHNGKDYSLALDADAFIECLGFMLADGYTRETGYSREFRLCQSESEQKTETVRWIHELNSRLGGLFTHSIQPLEERNSMNYWSVTHKPLSEWVRANFYISNRYEGLAYKDEIKAIPRWVHEMSKRQRQLFVDAFVRGDGSRPKDRKSYHLDICYNLQLAESLLELYVSLGHTVKMSTYEGKTHLSKDKIVTTYRIHVCEHIEWSSVSKRSWVREKPQRVVCFTVPSGLLITQKDYKTHVSGNCLDPIITYEVGMYCWSHFKHIHKIFPLDNTVGEIVRQSTKQDLAIDYEEVARQGELQEAMLRETQQAIFNITGYPFKLNSNKEKIEALSRFVTLTQRTDKGALSVKADVLERINHPLAKLLARYAELVKFIGTYVQPIALTQGKSTKVKFSCCNAPTGRLAAGGAKNNSYFMPINIQAIPKKEETLYVHPHPMLGIHLTTQEEGAIGTCETKSGFRRVFNAPEGYAFMSFDYSSQEVRIATNYSKERTWADAINNGWDIHMATAKTCFGQETKEARGHAKSTTFGIIYGMTSGSLAHRIQVSRERGKEIYDAFLNGLTSLTRWMANQKLEAKKRGIVYTFFGRPRNLSQYYNTSDPQKVAFGDRSAVNTVIQACGADVLRKKFCELHNLFQSNQEFRENVKFAFSCYDEMNFYVKFEYIEKAYDLIKNLMYEMHPEWLVPLEVEGSVGLNWGDQIAVPEFLNGKVVGGKDLKLTKTYKENDNTSPVGDSNYSS